MGSFQKIIVRMPNWVGDLVMATPVLTDLRKAFPTACITAMCKAKTSDLLKNDRNLDELFSFTKPENSFARRQEYRDIIAKIEAGKYDLGILLTHSFSSAWWFWRGKVKRRIGFSAHFRRFLLTDPILFPSFKEHEVITYKRVLEPLGIPISSSSPRLYLEEEEIKESKELLFQQGYVQGRKLIGINPGAVYGSAKCWPKEKFRSLALQLLEKTDAYLVFFGDASNIDLVKQIAQGLPKRAINLAGMTSLRELSSIIKDCTVLITNDSGPMHIGAALGTPLVALFGSTDEELTGPYGQTRSSVLRKKVSCSPCFKRVCPIDFRCMQQIEVHEVLDRVLQYV